MARQSGNAVAITWCELESLGRLLSGGAGFPGTDTGEKLRSPSTKVDLRVFVFRVANGLLCLRLWVARNTLLFPGALFLFLFVTNPTLFSHFT